MGVPRRAQKEDPTKLDHHHRRSIQVDGPLCHLKRSHTPVSMCLSPIPTVQIIKSIQIILIIMIPGIIIIEEERDCHRRLRTSAAQRRKRQDKSHELSRSGCGPVEGRIQARAMCPPWDVVFLPPPTFLPLALLLPLHSGLRGYANSR